MPPLCSEVLCYDVDSVVRAAIHLCLNLTCCLLAFEVVLVMVLLMVLLKQILLSKVVCYIFEHHFRYAQTLSDSALCLDIGPDLCCNLAGPIC